jgi:hypothetical protein
MTGEVGGMAMALWAAVVRVDVENIVVHVMAGGRTCCSVRTRYVVAGACSCMLFTLCVC